LKVCLAQNLYGSLAKRSFGSASGQAFARLLKIYTAEAGMMNQIFDWCVNVLVYWAGVLGITYKEINVWVFVIVWPILTVLLIGIIVVQYRTIRKLSRKRWE